MGKAPVAEGVQKEVAAKVSAIVRNNPKDGKKQGQICIKVTIRIKVLYDLQ